MISRLYLLLICLSLGGAVTRAQEHRLVASLACYNYRTDNQPIPFSPSNKLFVLGEEVRSVVVRHVDRPFEVWARIPIANLLGFETCTPITFETDSLLLLSATMRDTNFIIAVNVYTQNIRSYPVGNVRFYSKHGRGLVIRSHDSLGKDTTWSFFDGENGRQRPFAKGGLRGTAIRNGDFLLQDGNLLRWYSRSTGELLREVTIPTKYQVDTNQHFADSDQSRNRLFVSATNPDRPKDKWYIEFDFTNGITRERLIFGYFEHDGVTVSPSGRYVSVLNGVLYDMATGSFRRAGSGMNLENIVFIGDTAVVATSFDGLVEVKIGSLDYDRILALPWLGRSVKLSGDGRYLMDSTRVFDLTTMMYGRGMPPKLHPVAGGRQFVRTVVGTDARIFDIIMDASTLEDIDSFYVGTIYDTRKDREVLDYDLNAKLVLEHPGDTSVLMTNYFNKTTVRFKNSDFLQPRYRGRLLASLNSATVIGEYGAAVLRNIKTGRVLRAQLPFVSVSRDIENGILPLSPTISSVGDIVVTDSGRAAVMTFAEQNSSSPEYVNVEPCRFYGFTVDDKVAMVTRSGNYVLYDKQMNLILRDKIADTILNDSWLAHLCYSGRRLLIADAKDRIDVYEVSRPVSVDEDSAVPHAVTKYFWASSTSVTLPGTVVSIHDELGRNQQDLFTVHAAGSGSTLHTTLSVRGLYIIRMADGTGHVVYCE